MKNKQTKKIDYSIDKYYETKLQEAEAEVKKHQIISEGIINMTSGIIGQLKTENMLLKLKLEKLEKLEKPLPWYKRIFIKC